MGFVLQELAGIQSDQMVPKPAHPTLAAEWHWRPELANVSQVTVLLELSRAWMSIPIPRSRVLVGREAALLGRAGSARGGCW